MYFVTFAYVLIYSYLIRKTRSKQKKGPVSLQLKHECTPYNLYDTNLHRNHCYIIARGPAIKYGTLSPS
jgi:hypothetical protein